MPRTLPNVIEMKLRGLNQLYNSLDPSPFHEKDLDDDADEFITSWAMEFPVHEPVALMVYLDQPCPDAESQQVLVDAIHYYYNHKADLKRRELRALLSRGRTSLLIGLAFLAVCMLLSQAISHMVGVGHATQAWIAILGESLIIVGWVALWRPLEIFLYDWWPVRHMVRLYQKLSTMEVAVAGKD